MGADIFGYALLYIAIFVTITGASWLMMKVRRKQAMKRIHRNIELIKRKGNI